MTRKLYVGNLPHETTPESLREAFLPFGQVVDLHVMVDRYSGRPRGFAFVTMASEEQAASALTAMNGTLFEGRALRVSAAEVRPQQVDPTRNR